MRPLTATPASAGDPDLDTARDFARNLKIACDELHDDPFNPDARAALLHLLQSDCPAADAAFARVVQDCRT